MASTYSPSLRLELIATGEQSGLWGDTTNNNLGALLEQAITGVETITMLDLDYTLSALNGSVDESRNAVINMTSVVTLTATRNVFIPADEKIYIISNTTLGGQSLTVKVSGGGTGYEVPNGKTCYMYCDGTNVKAGVDYLGTLTATNITATNLTATNLTLGSGTTGTGSYVRQTSPTITTPTITTPTISGGTITGITDLAVADGGTGASDATTARSNLGLVIGTNIPSPTGTGASGTWNININGNVSGTTGAFSGAVNIDNYRLVRYDSWCTLTNPANTNGVRIVNQAFSAAIWSCDNSGNMTAAGNVTAYSDARLKTDVKTITNALDTVDALRGVAFVKDGQAGIGVIAQEVQKVLPQVVHEGDEYLSVAYGNMVGLLIEAVKELRAEVKALKGE